MIPGPFLKARGKIEMRWTPSVLLDQPRAVHQIPDCAVLFYPHC